MADLRDRRHRVHVRYLRAADAASDRRSGAAGTHRRRTRLAGISALGGQAVLHSRCGGRHLRLARRISHRSAGKTARADVEHPHLRVRGLCLRIRHFADDAAGAEVFCFRGRLRRVCRGRRLAGGAFPASQTARAGARLYTGVFLGRWLARGDGERARRVLGKRSSRDPHPGVPERPWRRKRPARRMAIHDDVGADSGHPVDHHPPFPARITRVAGEA